MNRVITFLGELREGARPAGYRYGDHTYQGMVFPEALRQFIDYDEMNVFVTRVACQTAWPRLEALKDDRIKAVEIPDGRTPEDRWLIFDKLLSVVKDGDTLIFDITHGYRTLFFFVFLAIAYLKSARQNVTVQRVLYGEWSQGDTPGPVIDLTEYISLLDWMSATDQFVNFGNSQALVQLVRNGAASGKDAPADRLALRQFAAGLDQVSRTLQLAIPDQAMTASDDLTRYLAQAREPMARHLRPFLPLAGRVDNAFAPIALADPRIKENIWPSLALERDIIAWYLDRQLLLQAITIAFEWLLSYGIACLDYSDLYDGDTRYEVRMYYTATNKARRLPPSKVSAKDREYAAIARDILPNIPDHKRLLALYEDVTQLRNDLLHASKTVGEARSRRSPEQWEDDIRWVCRQLDTFPLSE